MWLTQRDSKLLRANFEDEDFSKTLESFFPIFTVIKLMT